MRGDANIRPLRLISTMALLLLFVTFLSACSDSGDEEAVPTSTVVLVPAATATTTAVPPTSTPVRLTQPPPTEVPVAPAATTAPAPTATAIPVPTATSPAPTPTSFPLGGDFFLTLVEPVELDIFASISTIDIIGQTRVDAVVTVNDDVVTPDSEGIFEHTVSLDVGINVIEVVGSVSADEQASYVITVIYLP